MVLKVITIGMLMFLTFIGQVRAPDDNQVPHKKRQAVGEITNVKLEDDTEVPNKKFSDENLLRKRAKLLDAKIENVNTQDHSGAIMNSEKYDKNPTVNPEDDGNAATSDNEDDNTSKNYEGDYNRISYPEGDNESTPILEEYVASIMLELGEHARKKATGVKIDCDADNVQNMFKKLYAKEDVYEKFLDYETMRQLIDSIQGKHIGYHSIDIRKDGDRLLSTLTKEIYNIKRITGRLYIIKKNMNGIEKQGEKTIQFSNIKFAHDSNYSYFVINPPESYKTEKPAAVLLRCTKRTNYCLAACLIENFTP